MIENVGSQAVRDTKLCIQRAKRTLRIVIADHGNDRTDADFFHFVKFEGTPLHNLVQGFHRSLHPHVGGPVFQIRIADVPMGAEFFCVPRGILLVRNLVPVTVWAIQSSGAVVETELSNLGGHNTIAGTVTMREMIDVGLP